MKTTIPWMALAISLVSLTAVARDALSSDQIVTLITANTHYAQNPAGAPGAPEGGVAPIYYCFNGYAAAALPAGQKLVGAWAMTESGCCIDWETGPKNSRRTLARAPNHFVVLDASISDPCGTVDRIMTGNLEGL